MTKKSVKWEQARETLLSNPEVRRAYDAEMQDKAPPRVEFELEDLIAQITPENKHDLIDFGLPVGKEIW